MPETVSHTGQLSDLLVECERTPVHPLPNGVVLWRRGEHARDLSECESGVLSAPDEDEPLHDVACEGTTQTVTPCR